MVTATAKAVQRLHFDLPPLPYAEDALAPVISAETLSLHHGKHHKKYIDTTNELVAKAEIRGSTLEDVVRSSQGKLFNNAAQAWNHEFYWHSLTPKPTPRALFARSASIASCSAPARSTSTAIMRPPRLSSGCSAVASRREPPCRLVMTPAKAPTSAPRPHAASTACMPISEPMISPTASPATAPMAPERPAPREPASL